VRGTVYADTGWFKGQIIGGNATTYASGTGMWTGVDAGTWKFRLGSSDTYLRWDGASLTLRGTLTIEDGSGNVLLSSGSGVPWDKISGVGKPENDATNSLRGAPLNLIPDDGFYLPGWWQGNRALTTWPAGWIPLSGGTNQPARMLWITSDAGTFDKSSEWFDIRQGGKYRVRLRMYLSPDFAGFIAPLVHFPWVVWGIPGSVVADPSGVFPAGHTAASWGVGSWIEREVIYTASAAECIHLQTRICGRITAGGLELYMEVTSVFAGLDQITPSNVTTYIANAAIGAAQIGSINLVGTSNFAVKTATSGARMDMDSRRIKVFDKNDVLRVQLGDLTV
jgi:hypothetical protein